MESSRSALQSLRNLHYAFNSDLQLRHLQTGKPFKFINQDHYEELADAVADFIQELMVEKYAMKKVDLPSEEDLSKMNEKLEEGEKMNEKVRFPIYLSSDVEKRDIVLILLCGSGRVMAGQWARRLCINDSLKKGSILPFLDWAKEHSFGVVVLNPNYSQIQKKEGLEPIPYNKSSEEHVAYVWQAVCATLSAKHFVMVAHSYGGISTCNLLRYHGMDVMKRLRCVAFTDSIHSRYSLQELPKESQQFIAKNCINWASSTKPLDTVLDTVLAHWREWTPMANDKGEDDMGCNGNLPALDQRDRNDHDKKRRKIVDFLPESKHICKVVSAGTRFHELTTMSAFPSVCKFLLESLDCAQALS